MSKTFRAGDTIRFRARINGDPATDNPIATVLDPTDQASATLTIGSGLSQVGGSRIVRGSFVPNVNGEWSISFVDDTGLELVKQFFVGDFSLESVGAQVASNEAKLDLLAQAVTAIDSNGGGHFG